MRCELFADVSGLEGVPGELRAFLAAIRWDRPAVLWLLFVPVAVALGRWGVRNRWRRRLAAIGRPGGGWLSRPRRSIVRRLEPVAWVVLVVGLANPRWGTAEAQGVAVGRDLIILVDFSRSMWATDMATPDTPARWQAAVAAVGEWLQASRTAGGHRVAVIVFAARPKLLVPLTTDVDHVLFRLGELEATTPPGEIRPADDRAVSGTRIGSALRAAVDVHDPRFSATTDVLLVTDADDPAGDDDWRAGVSVTRAAGIPVHVVGVGDPDADSFILHRGAPLEAVGPQGVPVPIQTRYREAVARAIAVEGQGAFLSARRDRPDFVAFTRTVIDADRTREVTEDRLPQRPDRSAGFFLVALIGYALVWWRG